MKIDGSELIRGRIWKFCVEMLEYLFERGGRKFKERILKETEIRGTRKVTGIKYEVGVSLSGPGTISRSIFSI